MTPPSPVPAARKGWLDRALSIVSDVRAGEGLGAVMLAANVFALLAFYYILKTVREALILSEEGAEIKSYAAAGQALLLLAFVPLYGMLASRVNRLVLISGVTVFFAAHLVVFYLLGAAGVQIGVAFFLWMGVFAVVMPAQFWAFANDVYDGDRGKRLFPIVGIGSSLGAWAGAEFASELFDSVGPYPLLLWSAPGLVATTFLTWWIHIRMRRQKAAAASENATATGEAEAPLGKEGGFRLVFSQRYLLLIALLVMTINVVNTVGEFILGQLVTLDAAAKIASGAAAPGSEAALIGGFYGDFFAWVNLLGFALQLLVVSRLFKYVGVRGTLFVLPLVAAFTYGSAAAVPLLAIVSLVKVLENSTDYSINNTAKHALFLPTSREAKYKAKQAIDSFFWRAGDMLQAVVVFVGVRLALEVRGFAIINLALIGVWLLICVGIAREHRKLTGEEEQPAPVAGKPAAAQAL
jgi:AAA family ATP:ADP antiporter